MKIAANATREPQDFPNFPPESLEKGHYHQSNIVHQLELFLHELKNLSPQFEDLSQYNSLLKIINRYLPAIYQEYDKFIKHKLDSLESKVTCEKTCSTCCSHFVASVEPFELIYLDHSLKSNANYSRLLHQLSLRHQIFDELAGGFEQYNEDQILYEYLKKEIACPFLSSENTCTVYAKRPIPCRMFFSLSHPRFCRGVNTVLPENKNFLVELSDDVEVSISQVSHWFRELELPNLYFPGLLKVNEIFGRYG